MSYKYSAGELEEMFLYDLDLEWGDVCLAGLDFATSVVIDAIPWLRDKLFEQWLEDNAENIKEPLKWFPKGGGL